MEDGPPKPDPFPVIRAAKLMGVDPKDTALVSILTNSTGKLERLHRQCSKGL